MTNEVRKLITDIEISEAKTAFSSVFNSGECIDDPFSAAIEKKAIIYYHQYGLHKEWYEAIRVAADELGESKAYISEVGIFMAKKSYELLSAINKKLDAPWDVSAGKKFTPRPFEKIVHWSVDLSDYPFDIIRPIEEIAIYSQKGTWGIIFADLGYAIIGGPLRFFETLLKIIPNYENEVYEFLRDMHENLKKYPDSIDTLRSWLPTLVAQIYGKSESEKMLAKAGLAAYLK